MSKELILDPDKPPHTNTISLQRAVAWNVFERTGLMPVEPLTRMFANLLDELIDYGALLPESVGRILAMSVTDIQDVEKMPPFQEDLL